MSLLLSNEKKTYQIMYHCIGVTQGLFNCLGIFYHIFAEWSLLLRNWLCRWGDLPEVEDGLNLSVYCLI